MTTHVRRTQIVDVTSVSIQPRPRRTPRGAYSRTRRSGATSIDDHAAGEVGDCPSHCAGAIGGNEGGHVGDLSDCGQLFAQGEFLLTRPKRVVGDARRRPRAGRTPRRAAPFLASPQRSGTRLVCRAVRAQRPAPETAPRSPPMQVHSAHERDSGPRRAGSDCQYHT
jgi:hypothetical protein